jgi:hypothetical protein
MMSALITAPLIVACIAAPRKFVSRTHGKLEILRKTDAVFLEEIRNVGLYGAIWQAFAVLLPAHSVGVMGDARSYDFVYAPRAVTSTYGMTPDCFPFPHEVLASRVGVVRVTDNADDPILRERARRPRLGPCLAKPPVGRVVPNMGRVNQGNQHIDVDKKSHDNSSRNSLTISVVTITPGSRRGTPFRSAAIAGGRSELRASSDTTLPTV